MPKPRHDNPYAERRIVELDLPRWLSRRELAEMAEERARRERAAAEVNSVPWAELSPAEIAFVYLLRASWRYNDSLRGEFAKWAGAVRESAAAPAAPSEAVDRGMVQVELDDASGSRER